MAPTFVLITGGNRGLGWGLVKRFLEQPHHTVIAANRDPSHSTSQALANLPKGEGSSLIVVKYDAAVEQDAHDIAQQLQEKHRISYLDTVVANAGIAKYYPLVKDVKLVEIQEHVNVNVYGVISLYQATRGLLQRSPNKPRFVPIGSGSASLGHQPLIPNAAYGPTKTMVNWYGIRINAEEDWLNTFVLEPGFVQTDMGNTAAWGFGMEKAPTTVDESVNGLYRLLTTATKEEYGGKVISYTGEIKDW